jgi:hypothetical protein
MNAKLKALLPSFIVFATIIAQAFAQSTGTGNALSGALPSAPGQFLGSNNEADVIFKSFNVERMRILSSGNIGIGTAAPTEKLQIHEGVIKLTGATHDGGPMITFGGTPSVAPGGEWGIEYTTSVAGREGLNFWKPFQSSGTSGNYFLFLGNSGRVGINTDNTTAQLTVNGNVVIGSPTAVCIPNNNYKLFVETGILTEKVKVAVKCTNNWSDHVFNEDHKPPSLPDVEKYITEHKHLPNIPSAAEVVKDGIDLGEMTSKLLEKVEELTLYAIEQNKRIESLQTQVSDLQKSKSR